MKKYLILLLLMVSTAKVYCQNATDTICQDLDSIVVSSGLPGILVCFYPLSSDKHIERRKREVPTCRFVYPLLILNNVIIRDKEQINRFRNSIKYLDIKRTKIKSKEKAERMGIQNVPKDGVLFITTKKKYYFDLSCE